MMQWVLYRQMCIRDRVLSAAMILGVAVPVAAEPVSAGQGVEAEQQPIVENRCV